MEIDRSKLTFSGSMNYILQIFSEKDSDEVQVDQYQPRKNMIWTGTITKEGLKPQVEETIERMKIAIKQMEEYLQGKRDTVYYWQFDDELMKTFKLKVIGKSSRLPVSTATIKSDSQSEAIKAFYEAYPKMANNDDFYLEISEVAQ